jgi:hypothetical protein
VGVEEGVECIPFITSSDVEEDGVECTPFINPEDLPSLSPSDSGGATFKYNDVLSANVRMIIAPNEAAPMTAMANAHRQ